MAITRARQQTRIYAARDQLDLAPDASRQQQVRALAQRLGRSEPEIPSISIPLAHEQRVEAQHGKQTLDRPGRQEKETLERLRAQRDQARAVLATFPSSAAGRIREAQQQLPEARAERRHAHAQAQRLRAELDRMRRWQLRGEHGQRLREQLAARQRTITDTQRSEQAARAEIEQINMGPESPARWQAQHPDARERLQTAEAAFEQALDKHAARAPENPGEHLTRVLGQRSPATPAREREAWDHGAHAIERYRAAHNIDPAERTALGPRAERSHAHYEQLQDWRAAGEQAIKVRERLGISAPGLGTLQERLARITGIMPERDIQRTRDIGIER